MRLKLELHILAVRETAGRRRHRFQSDQVGECERTNRVVAAQFDAGEDLLSRRQFVLKRKDRGVDHRAEYGPSAGSRK